MLNSSAYAVIPNYILQNENLSDFEVRLYGIISQLANKNGFCFATNEFIANTAKKTERTISAAINKMAKLGVFVLRFDKNSNRKIYLSTEFYKFDIENQSINEQKQPLNTKTDDKQGETIPQQEKTLKTQKNATIAKNATSDLILPNFIDKDIFQNFVNHRKELKKPMTENAKKLLIKKLENFHLKGFDCNEILNTSIINGWQGVFEPKQSQANLNANKSLIQRLNEQEARILAKYEAKNDLIDCEILGG